ncbi:RHS repeat domain-containing protein [Serratia quinivorans]|uniref:RHS repeat domain-containing protein n=1 Tax=Serratia quinivorans TaxID=137545 RepID=UPI0021774D92|nr:RHS repeat domain-containing protein [Serratia quinivorans]CAI1219652.1 Uncharacterized conserved protein [Serratia quinivorans]
MSTSLFGSTPSVAVLDNRGLLVRELQYHRHPDTPEETDERITCHQHDERGSLSQSADPRLHAAGLTNFTYLNSLTGTVLQSVSADAGTSLVLSDAAGRAFLVVTGAGTEDAVTRTWQYEDDTLPGRPLSITEQVTGEAAQITERFVYAGNTDAEKMLNLVGQCVSHYDTAGLVQTDSIALSGVPLAVTRQLLPDTAEANWVGEDVSAWNDLLDGETFFTQTHADATGAVLSITDTKGNLQRVAYDVAGLLSGSWLTVKGGTEQIIVASLTYSAAGQKLREEHGNGVITTYIYEPETQRLTGIKTERPPGHVAGAKVLQDLRYAYDPVGNVLSVNNDAEETRFWRNQKVVPENMYIYDSLYQLVSATGREMANAGQQGNSLPSATAPLPTDSSAYTNYTRTYRYDRGGNLTQIRHSAPATNNNYATDITVSDRSNRAVLSTLAEVPSDVDMLFSAGGHQKHLQPGQALVWTPRGELQKVTPVVRDGGADDSESYRYDGDSQRVLKISVQKTGTSTQTQRVQYLPGLELRSTKAGNTETEGLQVITVGEAGRAQVRGLHWESGKPAEISNNQLRWSYDNLIGSSNLELDGDGNIISMEEYYPYGGTAVWTARSAVEADYKTIRYSGKERDASGLDYYGYRYYQSWSGRWLSADPAGTIDGLNLFRMVRNNPVTWKDSDGRATILGSVAAGIVGGANNGITAPVFSFSSFSLPSFSLSDINPLMPLNKVIGFLARKIYQKGFRAAVNKLFGSASSDQERVNYARWARAVGIGLGVGAAIATTLMTAGAALPVILGGAAAATLIGGGIGYFSGKITSAFSRLLHRAPGPASARAAVAAQFGNAASGGTTVSAINTAIISGVADSGLKIMGKSSTIRVTTGGEIGVAAGTDVQLHAGRPGRGTQYAAPVGVAIGAIGAESFTHMEGIGELAAASAYEGAMTGKNIDKMLGFTGGNIKRRLANKAVSTMAGVNISEHPAEFALSTLYSAGKSFLEVRTRATNNFNTFRRPSFD